MRCRVTVALLAQRYDALMSFKPKFWTCSSPNTDKVLGPSDSAKPNRGHTKHETRYKCLVALNSSDEPRRPEIFL